MAARNGLIVIFSASTAEEIRKGIAITVPLRKGKDYAGTVYDPRLGAMPGEECGTCHEKVLKCSGHFGFIDLPEPCFNPVYEELVVGILQSICFDCQSPRIELEQNERSNFFVYKEKAKGVSICGVCGAALPKFSFRKAKDKSSGASTPVPPAVLSFFQKQRSEAEDLSPRDVLDIFERISDEALEVIGFNRNSKILQDRISPSPKLDCSGRKSLYHFRPEALITQAMYVLPTTARPRVMIAGEFRSDDLTEAYNKIVKLCNSANATERLDEESEEKYQEINRKIQMEYWKMHASAPKNGKASGNRVMKSIGERIGGKDGRKHLNVAGKRADYTSRTVGSPGGTQIPFGSVGFPEIFAAKLSTEEPVTSWNIDWYQKLLEEGKINTVSRNRLPRVVSKICEGGKPFQIGDQVGLKVGDVVRRQMMDGDPAFFNRQPTLKIENIQGVEVKLVKENTHKLPLANTRGLGADFDGDEMNMYVPQGVGLVEAMTVASARYHIVTAQSAAPVMGPVQNTLVFAGICTNTFKTPRNVGDEPTTTFPDGSPAYEVLISRNTAYDCYVQAGIPNHEIKDYCKRVAEIYPEYIENDPIRGPRFAEYITGKVLYSIIFPPNYRWERNTDTNPVYKTVNVYDGILTRDSAPLCKASIGATPGSFVHLLWRDHPMEAQNFINRVVMISGILNFRIGMSFSLGDCQATEKAARDIKKAIFDAERTVSSVLEKGLDPDDEEREINRAYNKVREISPSLAKENMKKGMHNSLTMLTVFGIKGNPLNVSQTAGITGQQNLGSGRIPWCCAFGTRMSPHFRRNDKSPLAKGFITSSYLKGLNFREAQAAAITGREGVVASGTKTADSGYFQKKLTKRIGDVKAFGDGSLRNAQGQIISFLYGGDGLNAKMLIGSHTPEMKVVSGTRRIFFVKLDHLITRLESDFEYSLKENAKERPPKKKISKQEAEAVASGIQAGAPGYQGVHVQISTENQKENLISLLTTVTTYTQILPDLAEKIRDEYERAKVYNGYAAGLVACLSIGEITTQLTLNVFQTSGIGEKNASLGIPRLNELTNMTKIPKKPTMTIYLKDKTLKEIASSEVSEDETKLRQLKRCTELAGEFAYKIAGAFYAKEPDLLRVGDYDSEKESPASFEEHHSSYETPEWLSFYCETFGIEDPSDTTEWVIRLNLDPKKMYSASATPWDIAEAIEKYYASDAKKASLKCFPSPSSENEVLVFVNPEDAGDYAREGIRYPEDMNVTELLFTEKNISYFAIREIASSLKSVPVKGVLGIQKAIPRLAENGEWVIDTQGSSFAKVLADPGVDATRTITDNIWEIYVTLGIEAARACFEEEFKRIIRFDGASVDDRHFSIVADAIAFSGILTPISRHGISRDVGPISKLMFERPTAEAANSVAYGDVDQVQTIDAAIYMGQVPKLGTGVAKVISGELSRSTPLANSGPRSVASSSKSSTKSPSFRNRGKPRVYSGR